MSLILCIDTATPVCSIALVRDNEVLYSRESSNKNSHSEIVTIFIDEVIKEANLKYTDLDAVAVSKGPGSTQD